MYAADISKATVLALFLLPVNLNKLAPKFLDMTPGSRIVGNTFGIDGWEPDDRVTLDQSSDCSSWCEVAVVDRPRQGRGHLEDGERHDDPDPGIPDDQGHRSPSTARPTRFPTRR